MSNIPTNKDDVIDSRDIIERLEELESERESLVEAMDEAESEAADAGEDATEDARNALSEALYAARRAVVEWDDDATEDARNVLSEALYAAWRAVVEWDKENGAELKALKDLDNEADGYGDWRHGETLVRDSYFERYAQDLAEDIGAIPDNTQWPCTCIDWEQAARELQMDYTSVEFDGVTYWLRS